MNNDTVNQTRTKEQIDQEYTNHAVQAGHMEFQIKAINQRIDQAKQQIADINGKLSPVYEKMHQLNAEATNLQQASKPHPVPEAQ